MIEAIFLTPWMLGLIVVSGVMGLFGGFSFYILIRIATGAKEKIWTREFLYTGVLTGVVERLFFTALLGWFGKEGVDVGSAAIGWIAIKGQVHYGIFSKRKSRYLSRAYIGILGSIGSLLFAFAGGYFWTHPEEAGKLGRYLLTFF